MKETFKRFVVVGTLLLGGLVPSWAQSEIVKHVVDRGETIEDIAKKYGVTEADILKENPDAAQFIYVGMELQIPVRMIQPSATPTEASGVAPVAQLQKEGKTVNEEEPDWQFTVAAGYSATNCVGKDVEGKIISGFHVGGMAQYNISGGLFADMGLFLSRKGYKKEIVETSGDVWNDDGPNYDSKTEETMKTYHLDLPLNIGYRYANFFVKAGPYFSYAIAGEKTKKGHFTFNPDIHSGETEYFDNTTKISDIKEYNRFGVGINLSIGYTMDHFMVSGTYQRGFTKVYDKKKSYEQNFLVSLGYVF